MRGGTQPDGSGQPLPVRLVMVLTENWTLRPTPDLPDLVEMAVAAEAAGWDAVMVSEHVVLGPSSGALGRPANPREYALPGNQDPATPWPSPIALLAAVAARTTTLRLAASAVIAPLRHPLASAKELATVDRLSGGRLVVQPTVSWHREEYEALGAPWEQRGAVLDEHLEVWHRAWAGSPCSYEGRHVAFGPVWVEPRPVRGAVPLWFGGERLHGALLRRLVRWGAGFNPLGAPTDEDLRRLGDAMEAAGRDPGALELVGGTRARFPAPERTADLGEALAAVPGLVARGFRTICIKPSQFVDDLDDVGRFCGEVAERVAALTP